MPKAAGNGNLGYAIDIDVPGFHGIEPQIALNYNSSRKTKISGLYQGWLGYAWGLDGFDVIERATPGYGMPAYDANDIYLLDGQAMVACVAGMVSPSCSTGGTHATENESYRRIALNGTTNEWKVTDRDGTVSTFRSVAAVANLTPSAGTPAYDLAMSYRWLLTSVTDTNGNTVTYSYTCPASPVCYPDAVSYNGTVVKFYIEKRPDMILMGNGRDISVTSQRIKAVGVTVSGALRGAYKLTYDQAPFSNASRLTAVTRYGTDATIAADGTISGGTAKVLGQMTYQDAGWNYTTINTPIYEHVSDAGGKKYENPRDARDLDFDGRDELCCKYTEATISGGSTTEKRIYKRIIKFSQNGAPSDVSSLLTGVNPAIGVADRIPLVYDPGRFVASKNTMDFGQYTKTPTSATPSVVSTDSQLAMANVTCSPAPTIYQTLCSSLPSYTGASNPPDPPAFVADIDGDGVDTLESTAFCDSQSIRRWRLSRKRQITTCIQNRQCRPEHNARKWEMAVRVRFGNKLPSG